MIAPANFLRHVNHASAKPLASQPTSSELLPWADPYIAQLVAAHEAELAAQHAARPTMNHNRLAAPRRAALVAA